eukprot:2129679-Rhodomonas_salina.1
MRYAKSICSACTSDATHTVEGGGVMIFPFLVATYAAPGEEAEARGKAVWRLICLIDGEKSTRKTAKMCQNKKHKGMST